MIFSNNVKDLLKNIQNLPDDLFNIVQSYIPKSVTIFLTKESYISEHYLIRNIINQNNKCNIENYIRAMIRQDNDFVLKQLLVENYKRWLQMNNYYYRRCIYLNYMFFLKSYSIENDSVKCIKIINNLFEELGLNKNQHKKKTIRYIRWKT
jgi:hypothetical protein